MMKKYWKLVVLGVLIMSTIGVFYIQYAMASKPEYQLSLETVSGDQKELEQIYVGTYFTQGFVYQRGYIAPDGSIDGYAKSFVGQAFTSYVSYSLKPYVEQYRSFMRGKTIHENYFYEDDRQLVYADWDDRSNWVNDSVTLKIGVLDKKTEDFVNFEAESLSSIRYNWMTIQHVSATNGIIKVVAGLYEQNGDSTYLLYTIDPQQQIIVHETVLMELTSGEDLEKHRLGYGLTNKPYILYRLAKSGFDKAQWYVYNTHTSQLEDWTPPVHVRDYLGYDAMIEGENMYVPNQSVDGLQVYRYHFDTKQWDEPLTIEYPRAASDASESYLQVLDGKLYSVNRVVDYYMLLIYDVKTGELLYDGKINGPFQSKDNQLNIEQIYLR